MAFDLKDYKNDLLFVPLGGSNEIGMNLNLYHYQGKWLVVDIGIGFADDAWLPGVDVVVPNIDFLRANKHNIVAVILTHAHEDHVGGMPYFWNELECPVYATPFTAAFLRSKLMQEGASMRSKAVIKEVQIGAMITVGPFTVEMIGLTHSIPEMQALAISTEKGVIMHTGDWKLDPHPQIGNASDTAALQRYGNDGVLAMICDSTNVFVEGRSGSEADVRKNLVEYISGCEGRVVVTTFASNVARLETLAEAATQAGRKIVLAGRSLWRVSEAAKGAGYLQQYEFHQDSAAASIPRHELMVICTGCQGEPLAALPKITRGDHQHVRLVPGDVVIFSSRMIPGNEKRINYVQNSLVRQKIEVMTDRLLEIHVSGHPAREELADMYNFVRPHIAVPVHGEARHLHEHAKLAKLMQVPVTIEPYNGAVIRLNKENPGIVGEVTSGYVAIDGGMMRDSESPVIKMRKKLLEAGAVSIVLVVDPSYRLQAMPAIATPGSLDPEKDFELIETLREEIELTMDSMRKGVTEEKVVLAVRTAVRRIYKEEVGKKPVILVDLLRV